MAPLVIDHHLLHPSPFRCNLIMELTTNKNKFPSRLPSFHIDWPEDEESTDFKKFEEKVNPLHPENNTQKSQRRSLKTATVSSPCRKCKMLCGWESVALSFAMIFLGGAHFFVFTQYPPSHGGVWLFLLMAMVCFLLVILFIVRPVLVACVLMDKSMLKEDRTNVSTTGGGSSAGGGSCWNVLLRWYFSIFDVNGEYFLIKMHAINTFGNGLQVINMFTIYLCWMPISLITIISTILVLEIFANIYADWHFDSPLIRDRVMIIDVMTDIFCLCFPLFYVRLGYSFPIEVSTMLQLTIFPTISLLSVSKDIWVDVFHVDQQRIEARRRRKSILNMENNSKIFQKQLDHFPSWLRNIFTALALAFASFFVMSTIVQLSTQPSNESCRALYTEEIWNQCAVPVPFCQYSFVAKCDCAILQINNYSKIKFPESFSNMNSIILLKVTKSKLEQLPDQIGQNHPYIKSLQIAECQLKELPSSIGDLKNLITLWLFQNQLQHLPERIGQLSSLMTLSINNNNLTNLPKSIKNLKDLSWLYVQNNRLTSLSDSIGDLSSLFAIQLNNNQLTVIPKSIGKLKHLIRLDIFNNYLQELPIGFIHLQHLNVGNNSLKTLHSGMNALVEVDVRHNKLQDLPIDDWKNVKYVYAQGNPFCLNTAVTTATTAENKICQIQCSEDCLAVWIGDGFCDDLNSTYIRKTWDYKLMTNTGSGKKTTASNSGCNTKSCRYDMGDCL